MPFVKSCIGDVPTAIRYSRIIGLFFSFAHSLVNQTRMQKKWGNLTEDVVAI